MPLRRQAQRVATRALGPAHPPVLRRWRQLQAAKRARRLSSVTRGFVAWHGLTVSGGPFAGLRYPDASASSLIPKLLGTYERELHGAIERAVTAEPEQIVNVGAADGYYAVGLARRCPAARVHAFEADPHARELLARVAETNGVTLEIHGAATTDALDRLAAPGHAGARIRRGDGGTLVLIDCEGCEGTLLDPDRVPPLRTATIVAELHDFAVPGEAVIARFAATHEVTIVPTGPQPPERDSKLSLALSEYRPGPMRWAVMTPR
jgi:hypothetical protein